jgi:uncharacterized protein (TIGR02271 family)
LDGDDVVVPYDKATVKDAPTLPEGAELSDEDVAALYRHYGHGEPAAPQGVDERGLDTQDADDEPTRQDGTTVEDAMTRSEEELRVVGHRRRPRERVRLRKHNVTEYVTMRVPITREEVRMEREPVDEAETPEAAVADGDDVVTLSSEEPVIEKRAVPRERVRLQRDTVIEEERVSESLRAEHIDVEGDPQLIEEDVDDQR